MRQATYTAIGREEFTVVSAAAMMALLVSSATVPLAIKTSHPVRGRMEQSVRVVEIVCAAGASATPQRVESVTMVTSASVMMNTVRSSRTNCAEEMASASVEVAIVTQATRAQPVSAWCLRRAVEHLTTPCASVEDPASATAVSVRRDTSGHTASTALAALTHA